MSNRVLYRVVCNKEKELVEQGVDILSVYGGIPYRGLSRKDAMEVAKQLRHCKVAGEKYRVEVDKV